MSDVMKGAGYGTLLTELKIRISRWLTTTKWLVMREGAADVAIHRFVVAMTNDLAACCLITNHLATVLWLLSGMASCSISQMASSSIRSVATWQSSQINNTRSDKTQRSHPTMTFNINQLNQPNNLT